MLDEKPDPWLVERHEREIFPLLHRRAWFAEAQRLPAVRPRDRRRASSTRHVLAYSNGSGRERSLVLYHTRFASTSGTIRDVRRRTRSRRRTGRSARSAARWPRDSACPTNPAAFVTFRDARTGLEYLRSCREIWEHGLAVSLDAYGSHVFWEFREVWDGVAGQWARLAGRLAGAGVAVARRRVARAPARADPRAVPGDLRRRPDGRRPRRRGHDRAARRARAAGRGVPRRGRRGDRRRWRPDRDRGPDPGAGRAGIRRDGGLGRGRRLRGGRRWPSRTRMPPSNRPAPTDPERPHGLGRRDRATLLAWLTLSQTGGLAPGADVAATSLAWYDELRLPGALVAGLHDTGFGEGDAWAITDDVRVLLALPRPSAIRGSARVVAGPAARGVAGAARRRGSRSGSTPGRASSTSTATGSRDLLSLGRPPRHDRRAGRSDRGGQRACRGPSRGRGRGGRLSRGPAARESSAAAAPKARRHAGPKAAAAPAKRPAKKGSPPRRPRKPRATRAGSAGGATSAACRGPMTDSRCGR